MVGQGRHVDLRLRSLSLLYGLLLLILPSVARPNPISIWNDPAPPPDEGPPLSASAVRDPSLLWREIAGIVGAYVGTVVILLGCLLTVGRRLRHSAQSSNRTLEFEMHKPTAQPTNTNRNRPKAPPLSTDCKAASPAKGRRASFSKLWSNSSSRGPASPVSHNGSMSTVDESVVIADRVKAQEEMERLYAAVMEHDSKQSDVVYDANEDEITPTSARRSRPHLEFPELQHLRHRQYPVSPISPRGPRTPLSPSAIPEEHMPSPAHSQFQPATPSQRKESTTSLPPKSPVSDRLSKISSLSLFSSRSRDTASSPKKLRRGSIRHLPISPPIHSPQAYAGSPYAESQPLSPRLYAPGPPPLNPHQQASISPVETASPDSMQGPPMTGSPQSRFPGGSSTSSLPFRAAFSPPQSPAVKTTVVEWRQSNLGRGAPRTGVPHTPYSPYMPFSPITPITPSRIVTRQERRLVQRENNLRVMTEEDAVANDDEMWGT